MDLVGALAARIHAGPGETPRCLVAIDGPDTAGKTTLADRLSAQVGPHAERVSLDELPATGRAAPRTGAPVAAPGQALYRERDDPVRWADVVVDNSRPDMPTVLRGREHLQP